MCYQFEARNGGMLHEEAKVRTGAEGDTIGKRFAVFVDTRAIKENNESGKSMHDVFTIVSRKDLRRVLNDDTVKLHGVTPVYDPLRPLPRPEGQQGHVVAWLEVDRITPWWGGDQELDDDLQWTDPQASGEGEDEDEGNEEDEDEDEEDEGNEEDEVAVASQPGDVHPGEAWARANAGKLASVSQSGMYGRVVGFNRDNPDRVVLERAAPGQAGHSRIPDNFSVVVKVVDDAGHGTWVDRGDLRVVEPPADGAPNVVEPWRAKVARAFMDLADTANEVFMNTDNDNLERLAEAVHETAKLVADALEGGGS